MDDEYYQHQNSTPYPEGTRLPTMDPLTERLVHYAESYGRVHTHSTQESARRRAAEKEALSLAGELDRARRDVRYWKGEYANRGEEIAELNTIIARLEKKLPQKAAKKTAKKAKK